MQEISQDTLQAAQSGDLDAFRRFVQAFEGPIHHTVYRLVGSRFGAEVEDIVQEIFIKLFRALPQFEVARGTKLTSWVFTFVKNYCFDVLKRKRLPVVPLDPMGPHGRREISGNEPEPYRQMEAEELQAAIAAAVHQLPPDQRLAFVLREYEALSYAEIAEISQCSEGTVKSRIHRAKEALRMRLRPLMQDT